MRFCARFPAPDASEKRSRVVEIVSLEGSSAAVYEVRLDGESRVFDVIRLPSGALSILDAMGRHVEVVVSREAEGGSRAHMGATILRFEFLDELSARAQAGSGRSGGRRVGELRATIPGRVLRVSVESGQDVAEGQSLVVLEAMKMENEVRSPRAGRVKQVHVKPGQAVSAGEVLIQFE